MAQDDHDGPRSPHAQGWDHAGLSSQVPLQRTVRSDAQAVAFDRRTQAPAHTVAGIHGKDGEAAAVAAVRTERTGTTAPASDSAAFSEGNATENVRAGGPWNRGTAAAAAVAGFEARVGYDILQQGACKDLNPLPNGESGKKTQMRQRAVSGEAHVKDAAHLRCRSSTCAPRHQWSISNALD